MEEKENLLESLFEKLKSYITTRIELVKLKTIEKMSDVLSTLTIRLIILVIFSLLFLFLNLGIAFWLGELLGKIYFGFFIVSSIYLVMGLLILIFSKKIKRSISNFIITQSLK